MPGRSNVVDAIILENCLSRYVAQTATMVFCRVIIDATMGPFEMLKSEESMARLRKREHAPLTPYLKGIENRHRVTDQLRSLQFRTVLLDGCASVACRNTNPNVCMHVHPR